MRVMGKCYIQEVIIKGMGKCYIQEVIIRVKQLLCSGNDNQIDG